MKKLLQLQLSTDRQAGAPKQVRREKSPAPPDVVSRRAITLAMRIERSYPDMPPSEKCVADVLLDSPGRLAAYSATELAEYAKASKAAVTRCIRRLGYSSFAQARSEARGALQWGSPLYLADGNGRTVAAASPGLEAHFAADVEILNRTCSALSESELLAAAQAVATARRVVVIGYRNSHLLAGFARTQLGLLRPGVELVPTAGETLAEGFAELGREDIVVAVGFRRRVPIFMRAIEAAHIAGARILYLTDPGGSVAPRTATWTLRCHCRGASLFDSYVGALSVLNYLANLVAKILGEPARKRLQNVERMHGELGDLV